MIPIAKGPKPDILDKKAAEWTQELLAAIEDGKAKRKYRYNHQQLKAALIAETHGKCAFCESKLLHIAYGDIEHIVPKNPYPQFAYDWTNLTLACDKCNTNKGEAEGLADPYSDPVEEFFHFCGGWVFHAPGNEKAQFTSIKLQLNRPDLIERRNEKIERLLTQVSEIKKTEQDQLRRLLTKALIDNARDAKNEYTACAKAYVDLLISKGYLPSQIA